MAKDLLIGVVIGGALSGAFHSATAGARHTLQGLGSVTKELKRQQEEFGKSIQRSMGHLAPRSIADLHRQYERMGRTLDEIRRKEERLAATLARGEALRASRAELRGKIMETAAVGLAVGAPLFQSVRLAAGFEDALRDISITGEFSAAEEGRVGTAIRRSALQWNQTQTEIAAGIGALVAGGLQDVQALERYAPILAKTSTATRASVLDLGQVLLSLRKSLDVGDADAEAALNMLAYAGKRGQFELRDMAKVLPQLAPVFGQMGVVGKEAVAEIGAALQVARMGAGSSDEAANNFKNFLQKLFSQDTRQDFARAGIDIQQSMLNLRAKGFTPVQAMLEVITLYMGSKGPAASAALTEALSKKDAKERQIALDRIAEAYKLGELFQDMQAMNFIRPALANMAEFKSIKAGSFQAADQRIIDADWQRRTAGASEQFKAFKILASDIGLTIGETLLPPLIELMTAIRPTVAAFGAWAKEHPGLIKGFIGLAVGMTGLRIGLLGLRYLWNFSVLSPINGVLSALHSLSGKHALFKAAAQAGHFKPLLLALGSLRTNLLSLGARVLPFVATGLRIVLGVMLGPWGVAIALAAGLVYKYWEPIKAFFSGFWRGLTRGLAPVGQIIMATFRGLGTAAGRFLAILEPAWRLLRPIFQPVIGALQAIWGWFSDLLTPVQASGDAAERWGEAIGTGVAQAILKVTELWQTLMGLPMKFMQLGGDIVEGLINGVTARLTAARETVIQFGQNIKGWFTSTLGIQSPSRVFVGFGANISEGAAIGIERSSAVAARAAGSMAARAAAAAEGAAQIGGRLPGAAAGAGAGISVHFNPVIHIDAPAAVDVKDKVHQALQLSVHELEQMLRRLLAQQQRRAY